MNGSKNIDAIPDPFKKSNDSDSVDSEKFKKAFRVEKSEETGEKGARKRSQDLGEEEEDADVSIPVPQGLFKEYMTETEKGASILDADGGSKVHFVTDGGEGKKDTSKMFISDSEGGQGSAISVGVSENTPSPPNFSENDNEDYANDDDDNFPTEGASENTPTPPPSYSTSEKNQYDLFTNPPPAQQAEPSTTNSEPTDKKKEKEKEKAIQKAPIKTVTSEIPEEKEVEIKGAAPPSSKEPSFPPTKVGEDEETKPLPAENLHAEMSKDPNLKLKVEIKEEKDEKTSPLSSLEKLSDKDGGGHDKKDDSDKQNQDDTMIQTVMPISSPAGIVALQMSPFANMPSDVFTLFEKMVGLMTIQKDSGKSTTTVTLNMAGSVFDKSELVLEHYDTAPHAYNVQFFGSPESVEKFAKNFSLLNNAITESKLTFSINVLPPKLSKNYVNRVNGASEKGDKDEENDSEKKQK